MLVRKSVTVSMLIAVSLTATLFIIVPIESAETSSLGHPLSTPHIRFEPQSLTVQKGQTFTVAAVIENVEDLWGAELQIKWNTTFLSYQSHIVTVPVEYYPIPIPPSPYAGVLHEPVMKLIDEVDESGIPSAEPGVLYWFAYCSMIPAEAFNGSGTFFTMTFQAQFEQGVTTIDFVFTTLSDTIPLPIPHTHQGMSIEIMVDSPPAIIELSRTPVTPNYDQDVVVSAIITDDINVSEALLSYTHQTEWHNASMNRYGDVFNATIPTQPFDTTVQYKVHANDTVGNWTESDTYFYTIVDLVAPEVVVELNPTCPYPYVPFDVTRADEPVCVTANVTEPVNASGVAQVLLSYRVGGGAWWNTTMTYNETSSLWTTIIPGQLGNTTIEFSITAYDHAENTITTSIRSYSVKSLIIGDLNGDGVVNLYDAISLLINYGKKYS